MQLKNKSFNENVNVKSYLNNDTLKKGVQVIVLGHKF